MNEGLNDGHQYWDLDLVGVWLGRDGDGDRDGEFWMTKCGEERKDRNTGTENKSGGKGSYDGRWNIRSRLLDKKVRPASSTHRNMMSRCVTTSSKVE